MTTGLPTVTCSKCHEPIAWVTSENGRPMPIDPQPSAAGNVVVKIVNGKPIAHVVLKSERQTIEGTRFVAHFATCSVTNEQRRAKFAAKPPKPPQPEQGSLL